MDKALGFSAKVATTALQSESLGAEFFRFFKGAGSFAGPINLGYTPPDMGQAALPFPGTFGKTYGIFRNRTIDQKAKSITLKD